jgi:hypothetical protein
MLTRILNALKTDSVIGFLPRQISPNRNTLVRPHYFISGQYVRHSANRCAVQNRLDEISPDFERKSRKRPISAVKTARASTLKRRPRSLASN